MKTYILMNQKESKMKNKKLFAWVLIIAVAILTSVVIIFPSALAFSGQRVYHDHKEISAETSSQPDAVVQDFYACYLNEIGESGSEASHNPLTEKAYHDSAYLTLSFIDRVDQILAGFDGQGGYDPLLCAQDIPQVMSTDGTFFHNGRASVVMRSSFFNHFLTVDLQEVGDDWKIDNITCGNSPEGTVKAFYTWYLAYIGDRASGEMRNPLVDKAYQESNFLSEGFIQKLDEFTTEGISADPILMAQDIPNDFSVDPGTEAGTAIIHLQFGTQSVHHLKINLIEVLGTWQIDGVEAAQ
jgi:hypothetical protein